MDPCLYMKNGILFTVYCDDGIFFAKNEADIDNAIKELQNVVRNPSTGEIYEEGYAFDLEVESDLAGYLGVELQKTEDGSLLMSQLHLTDRIIDALGLTNANPVWTPANVSLGKDENGKPR